MRFQAHGVVTFQKLHRRVRGAYGDLRLSAYSRDVRTPLCWRGAAPRATPWSAHLLATATGVSGRRVDPACGANHLVIS